MTRRLPVRWQLVVLGLVLALSAAGCELLQALVSRTGAPGSPSLGPIAIASAPPQPDCTVAGQGTTLIDETSGFSLCLPANWRRLEAGDPSWIAIYGARDTPTERDVASGVLQDFAMPLEPRDQDHLVNLAVYVRPVTGGRTLTQIGDTYRDTISALGSHDIVRSDVTLPAGPAVHLTAFIPHTLNGSGFDDALNAYILIDGQRAYHIVFISSLASRDYYATIFLSIVTSLRYLTPSPSGH